MHLSRQQASPPGRRAEHARQDPDHWLCQQNVFADGLAHRLAAWPQGGVCGSPSAVPCAWLYLSTSLHPPDHPPPPSPPSPPLPQDLIAASQAMRAYVSYCAPTPLQSGVAAALDSHCLDKEDVGAQFHANFELLAAALRAAGATVIEAGGGYFLVADVSASGLDAMAFCRRLAQQHCVAAVPLSVFCAAETPATRSLVRFAVCKRRETIQEACAHLTPDIMKA